jgi:lactoylglutathione lyase
MNDTTGMQTNVQQVVPFFGVRDITESVRYYVDGLGFTMTQQWMDEGTLRWCRLELGGAAVMLQEFWKSGHHRNVPEERVGVGLAITFLCRDALALYRDMRSRGIDAGRPIVGNGFWVAETTDPDGYRLIFESPTVAAEETVYSEDESVSA